MKRINKVDVRTSNLVKKISENLKTLRKKCGYSQTDMVQFGFSSRWYQRLESGKHIPTIPTLNKLAVVFKVDISDLFK